MCRKLMIVITFQMYLYFSSALRFTVHPDRDIPMDALFAKYGYPLELHELVTDDGYILTMHRIPRGRNISSGSDNKYPVLLVHGTCGCVENFILLGPEKSIAYYLADRGFDVWLLSTRGSRYSRKHKTLNPDNDKKFWDFGWHEIAISDTPSAVDYILKITNTSKLFYVGHSQGTTTYFAFASERPEYNRKIILSVNMAPACLLGDIRNIIRLLGKHASLIQLVTNFLHVYELFPYGYTDLINVIGKKLCSEMSFFIDFCYAFVYFGEIEGDIAQTTPQLLFSRSPAHCSVRQLMHYFQIINSGTFRKYDYGRKGNLKIYGTKYPPLYSFSNMTAPIALFYAPGDKLCPETGVQKLASLLPNLTTLYSIPMKQFGHLDFLLGESATHLVYEQLVQLFQRYL